VCEDSEGSASSNQASSSRPQRQRQMSARLQDCEVVADNEVNEEGDLVHLAFLRWCQNLSMI
jgi:hypothetical protein